MTQDERMCATFDFDPISRKRVKSLFFKNIILVVCNYKNTTFNNSFGFSKFS